MTPMKAALTEKRPLPSVTMTKRKARTWKNTISTASIKTITTGDAALTSTVSAALIKTKTPAGADPAAVTMTGAKEDQPFRSRKMPDSDEAMIHWHRLIS